MQTEQLIQSLAFDTPIVSRHAAERRIAIGLAAGGAVTLAIVAGWLGMRPDLDEAMTGYPFWMKWGYTLSCTGLALAAILHVARPDAGRARWAWVLAVPFALMLVLAAQELATTPSSGWMPLWLGNSWRECSSRVALLSLPVFGGLLWAFRALAPTQLRMAGAAAGLGAGACAATIYGLHCPEVSATFVATWYTLGMVLSAGIGALVGPRLMRW